MSSPQRLQNLTSDILVIIKCFFVLDKVSFLGSSVLNLSPTEPPVSSRLLNLTIYPVETIITYSKN